jgi:Ser/Thr protein kinase RdoA (MazF antagonist)
MHTMADTDTELTTPDFAALAPDTIIAAVESLGLACDARVFALNSYENRVYQIGIDGEPPLIGKFYRPHRWRDEQILEEHAFTAELAELDIPVVTPLSFNGSTLLRHQQFRFALYPRKGGRTPELDNPEHLLWLGRHLGRIHAVAATRPFLHRPSVDLQSYVISPMEFLLQHNFIPDYLRPAYQSLLDTLIPLLKRHLATIEFQAIRLHGDCHPGNILWHDSGPNFVDFDDSRMGPAVQDLWMLISGDDDDRRRQLDSLLDGYYQFNDFDMTELKLIETLRCMRLVHYSGWLAQRWNDPAFPATFTWFNTPNYWEQHILQLKEQLALVQEN